MNARVALVNGCIEFHFDGWREERRRMASIELEILRRVGCASVDPTTETNRLWRSWPLEPFSTREALHIIAALKSFAIVPEIANDVRAMLGEPAPNAVKGGV